MKIKKKIFLPLYFVVSFLLIAIVLGLLVHLLVDRRNKQSLSALAAGKNKEYTLIGKKISPRKKILPTPTIATITPTPSPQPIIQHRQIKFGVFVEDFGTLPSLQQQLGTQISTVSIFKQFGNQYNSTFDLANLGYIQSQGMQLQIAWEPWNPDEKGNQSIDYLKAINEGSYDDYIRTFARSAKGFNGQIKLRFAHEMNEDWYPWGKRPTEYIAAYRHIHTIFSQELVTNVQWMWSINVSENPQELASYYPGDNVVDIIGIDGFNFGTTPNYNYNGWRSFSTIFEPTYTYVAIHYNKPISISETASSEIGGNKAAWIQELFTKLQTKFLKINEVIWFNTIKETDWRINSSQASFDALIKNL